MKDLITKTGEYHLPSADYHADPCKTPSLSASLADTILSGTPRHAWLESPRLNPDHEPVEKRAFDIGSAAHEVLLGNGKSEQSTNKTTPSADCRRALSWVQEQTCQRVRRSQGGLTVRAERRFLKGRTCHSGPKYAPHERFPGAQGYRGAGDCQIRGSRWRTTAKRSHLCKKRSPKMASRRRC